MPPITDRRHFYLNPIDMATKTFLFSILVLCASICGKAQEKNLAEKLGYPKDSKLLIIHADDIGVAHSVNAATIAAFEKKGISSGSIMVPCPWFPEIAAYAKNHPGTDFGIHITLTAEWKYYKWGGILPSNQIPSLLTKDGFFHESVEAFLQNAKPDEVEKEVRAQIDRAIAFGIKPTHLDSHMGSLFGSPELFAIFQKVGRDYKMPVLLPTSMINQLSPQLAKSILPGQFEINQLFLVSPPTPAEKWNDSYFQVIEKLPAGLNEIIVHLAYDDKEMQAVAIEHPDFGSAWRQRDYNFVINDQLKTVLEKNNIKLITWKQVQNVWEIK